MLAEIDCLCMIYASLFRGWWAIRLAALLPPFDPRGAGAAGRHLGPSDPLWWQSRGLCEPVSQGRASPKFLVTPKWHRQP